MTITEKIEAAAALISADYAIMADINIPQDVRTAAQAQAGTLVSFLNSTASAILA